MRGRAVIQTAAGMPDLLNGRFRFARWARIDPLLPFMSLIPTANSGRPRRERVTLMLRFTRRHIAINQRGSQSVHSPVSCSCTRVPL